MINQQTGPPEAAAILVDLVGKLTYKEGWTFQLLDYDRGQGSKGLTFMIYVVTPDSTGNIKGSPIHVLHLMPVPPAGYDVANWTRWLMEQIILVERHESMEFFKIDGVAPFFPRHDPGNDPYMF